MSKSYRASPDRPCQHGFAATAQVLRGPFVDLWFPLGLTTMPADVRAALVWLMRMVAHLLVAHGIHSWGLVLVLMASRILGIAAFFLPLKVLLIAGSEGVPVYAAAFITPETKSQWVVGLAAMAVVLYVVKVVLDRVGVILAERGARDLEEAANGIAVMPNQSQLTRDTFRDLLRFAASVLFVIVVLLLGLFAEPLVFAVVALLLLVLMWVFLSLAGTATPDQNSFGKHIRDNPSLYINIGSTTVFLSAFFMLLWPFLRGDFSNLLIAILSIIMLRQMLASAEMGVREGLRLVRSRERVSALVLADAQYERGQLPSSRGHDSLTSEYVRDSLLVPMLQDVGIAADSPRPVRVDSPVPELGMFEVLEGDASRHGRWLLHLLPRSASQRFANENALFGSVPRERLGAPHRFASLEAGLFASQLLEYGLRMDPNAPDTRAAMWALLLASWEVEPPRALVDRTRRSVPLLHERFGRRRVDAVYAAVRTAEERQRLDGFVDGLPGFRAQLRAMPLHVANPELGTATMFRTSDGRVLCHSWGRWALEPVGTRLTSEVTDSELGQGLEILRRFRGVKASGLTREHLRLANLSLALDRDLKTFQYRRALRRIAELREVAALVRGVTG